MKSHGSGVIWGKWKGGKKTTNPRAPGKIGCSPRVRVGCTGGGGVLFVAKI